MTNLDFDSPTLISFGVTIQKMNLNHLFIYFVFSFGVCVCALYVPVLMTYTMVRQPSKVWQMRQRMDTFSTVLLKPHKVNVWYSLTAPQSPKYSFKSTVMMDSIILRRFFDTGNTLSSQLLYRWVVFFSSSSTVFSFVYFRLSMNFCLVGNTGQSDFGSITVWIGFFFLSLYLNAKPRTDHIVDLLHFNVAHNAVRLKNLFLQFSILMDFGSQENRNPWPSIIIRLFL